MAYYDLRAYLQALEEQGRLHHIPVEVEADWEIAALCRRLFQTIPESSRPALLFERVKGSAIPLVVGTLGASRAVYALALGCTPEELPRRWEEARLKPLGPETVADGPCKEVILRDEEADLALFPHPTWSTHDAGPYITAPCIISQDPETGVYNIGTYRVQVKGPHKMGLGIGSRQDLAQHIAKNEALGRPTPVAVVIGPDPAVEVASMTKSPPGVDELAFAGGLRGEPVPLVPCGTVPLSAPATAEIVIEGEIPPGYREIEGPFGEYTGYMGAAGEAPIIEVRCITHRRNPIYRSFYGQMPPNEYSLMRQVNKEMALARHLRGDLRLPVVDLHVRESGGSAAATVVAVKRLSPALPRQVAHALLGFDPYGCKYVIVVDEDIDVRDPFAVEWAMSFHVQPAEDIDVVRGLPAVTQDPSQALAEAPESDPARLVGSKVIIDATRKHRYPPLSLPPREHLERVDARWESYGLPLPPP
ncbi:MAG TPA: UbiD family decarboxylase [Dehalococcoidia bacterium]|nr:UbiD family decarboxylase [Dehalococcoidia bacterium]